MLQWVDFLRKINRMAYGAHTCTYPINPAIGFLAYYLSPANITENCFYFYSKKLTAFKLTRVIYFC